MTRKASAEVSVRVPPVSMYELFARQVVAGPDRVAVAQGARHVSYQTLATRAGMWARELCAVGVGNGTIVGVHLRRTQDLVAALLGVLRAGGAYLPLDPVYPIERLDYMVTDSAITVLITADAELTRRMPAGVAVLGPGALPDSAGTKLPSAAVTHSGQLAYLLYTSGSTGLPKAVAITHANAIDLLCWVADMFGAELARVLATTSICFDCSILEIFGPLSWGGTVVLGESPMDIGDSAQGSAVRLLHTVPSVVAELLRTDRLPATVTTAILGGEALPPALVERLYARSSIERLVNLYGPTEYTSYATAAVVPRATNGTAAQVPPIGRPVANTEVYLLAEDGTSLAAGSSPGEIAIAGAGLAQGYRGRPGLTAERFVPEPFSGRQGNRMYRTGDFGRRDDDGVLHFLGRIDDQIKIRGVRIEPIEVEQVLLAHPDVREAAVVATELGQRQVLAAYLATAEPAAFRLDEVRAMLREQLPSPLVPETYTVLASLPRAPNGKLDRRRLPPLTAWAIQPCTSAPPVTTGWTAVLAALWANAIGVARIDPDADIFDIGGHSLAALRVRAAIAALIGVEPPARMLFEHPTIAALAAAVQRRYGPPPATARRSARRWPPPAKDPSRLSPTQLAVARWSAQRPGAADLVLPLVVRLRGRVDTAALGQALRSVVGRHDILRSVLQPAVGADPRLVPGAGSTPTEVRLIDLAHLPPHAAEAEAGRLAELMVAHPMVLSARPPVRMALLRLATDEWVLAVVLHRIAADPWSVEVVSHEILREYAAGIAGKSAALGKPVQYVDWAAEQRCRLDTDEGRAQLRYWRTQLARLPTLRLIGDDGTSTVPVVPVRHYFVVPPDTTDSLADLARGELATPYMVMLAAFAVLLHGWSMQEDLVIGGPTTGRHHAGLAEVVGPCADALALRCDLSGELTFRQLVGQMRERTIAALSNSDVPFVTLADQFGSATARHPIYQASIVLSQGQSMLDPAYRATLFSRESIGAVEIFPFFEELPATALDVEVMLFPRDDDIEGVLDCRPDAVAPQRVPQLAEDFLAIVDRGTRAPDLPVARLVRMSQ
jgi:amino acid adenylation domain-containing protein